MKPDLGLPYFPRPSLLEDTLKVFTSGLKQGVTLFAPRRHGKTSFVHNELVPAVREIGWRAHYVDLWKRRDHPELAVVNGLESAASGKRSADGLRLDRVEANVKAPGIAELSVDMVPNHGSHDAALEARLERAVERLLQADGTVLLVFDEFQALADGRSSGFVAALRASLQAHQDRLKVFYTGEPPRILWRLFGLSQAACRA